MTRLMLITLALLTVATVIVLGWRGQSGDRPPLQLFDDMVDQAKYKPQAESAFFADGRAMRTPPTGTIAWGRKSVAADQQLLRADTDYYEMRQFPAEIAIESKLMHDGQRLFNTFCAVCHGETGSGNGITNQYGMNAPSYHTEAMRLMTPGHVYFVITEGKGLMGPYGERIKPAERWAIVAYVRALQRSRNAKLDDVPPEHRGELQP